mmetsp:Transcript_17672/g.40956  ORF Transcript_17672/g.40956 Transcript_17672/m.40956 type:complete len:1433 (+) Transcript_17672:77-4375(+)
MTCGGSCRLARWLLFVALTCPTCQPVEAVKICYAFHGYVNDLGFTYSQNLARARIDAELDTASQYVEGIRDMERASQESVIDGFISNSTCQVVVLGLYTMQSLAVDYALLTPSIRFICMGCWFENATEQPENLAVVDVLIHQASYIAGLVAASQRGITSIGYVASEYTPTSFRNVNAFALGVAAVKPNMTMFLTHVGSREDARTERIAGKRLIRQRGVDLLAYDSDSSQIVEVAQEENIYSIAIKVDATASYGESNLMSRIFRWTQPLLATVRGALGLANWTHERTANTQAGFMDDAVSLGTFSTGMSTNARTIAEQTRERFEVEGEFTFCVGATGVAAFCPEDANLNSPEVGLYPCMVVNGTAKPADGDCFSTAERATMTWAAASFQDLGLVQVPDTCPLGTRINYVGDELCLPCEPGRVNLVRQELEECTACPKGRFAVNGLECRRCRAGSYSWEDGSPECTACEPGRYTSGDGQTACVSCLPGYFANSSGSLVCDHCDIGTFSSVAGQVECTPCGNDLTTSYEAARSSDSCVCAHGKYRIEDGSCLSCPEGMICPPGSDVGNMPSYRLASGLTPCDSSVCPFPQTTAGYMTIDSEPLVVYLCLTKKDCPGGTGTRVSECGPLRQMSDVACGLCQDQSFRNKQDDCEKCEGGVEVFTLLIVVIGACAALGFVAIGVNQNLLTQARGPAQFVIIGGVFLTAAQTTIVFNQLTLEWVEPMKTAMEATSLLSFNMGNLKMACVVAVDPAWTFFTRQFVAPACLPVLYATVAIKKYLSKSKTVNVSVEFCNAAGTLFSAFFISVVTTSMDALVCYEHPSGGSSVTLHPAVLCWDDDRHVRMVMTAFLAFLFIPLNFACCCVFAVVNHPRVMARNDQRQRQFHHRFRFLFFRFRPEAYAYGLFLIVRSLILCLIPAVLSGSAGMQVLLLCAIIISFGMYQATKQPWLTSLVNRVDNITSTVLILSLLCGIIKTDLPVSDGEIGFLSTVMLIVASITLAYGAGRTLADMIFPNTHYHFFLCHHMGFAAGQARYFQMLILKTTCKSVFLDADDLKDLSTLMDVVQNRIQHFLIYLTEDTLRRPWCLWELVLAKEKQLRITRIMHWSFEEPTEEDLADVAAFIKPGVSIGEHGVDADLIRKAIYWISGPESEIDTIHLRPDLPGTSIFLDAVIELARSKQEIPTVSMPNELDTLLISTDISDLEATAAGGILIDTIQQESSTLIGGSIILLADLGHKGLRASELQQVVARARMCVVVLTAKTLQSLQQVQVIILGMAGKATVVPVSTPGFAFPSDSTLLEVVPNLFVDHSRECELAMKSFFEWIAIPLTTHGSSNKLRAETSEVVKRIPEQQVLKEKPSVLAVQLPQGKQLDSCTSYLRDYMSGSKSLRSKRTGSTGSLTGSISSSPGPRSRASARASLRASTPTNWFDVTLVKHSLL